MLAGGLLVACLVLLHDDSRSSRREARPERALPTIESPLVDAPEDSGFADAVVERAFEPAVARDDDSIVTDDSAAQEPAPERRARVVGRLRRQRGDERPVREFEALIFALDRAPAGEWRMAQPLGGAGLVRESSAAFGDSEFAPAQLALRDGSFALTLAATSASERRELRLRATFDGSPREHAWIELPTSIEGTLDVGDVLLQPPAELASGVVVDERGEGIAGAHIDVQLDGVDARTEGWRFAIARWPMSTKDGSFVVRGDTSAASLQLDVSHPSFLAKRISARPNSSGLRIVLADGPRGTLEARLVLDDARAASDVKVILVDRRSERSHEARPRDGRVTFRGLGAGVYDLRLVLEPFDELLHSIDGLDVVDGRACSDARLERIDLPDAITTSEASLRHADGRPVSLQHVTLVRADGRRVQRLTDSDGMLRVRSLAPVPQFDVVTASERRLPFRLGAVLVIDD